MLQAVQDTFQVIETAIEKDRTESHAMHHGLRLNSAFQPIYSLSHCRVVGYEGLLRATDGEQKAVSPQHIFSSARGEPEIVYLDRLSRALHMQNFISQGDSSNWLFLNVNPQVIVQGKYYGSFFKDLLEYHNMPPERIVVEIIEGAIADEEQLSESVNFYKELGCLVAIDDFGAGHSNFERIWRMAPDIVKLDRSMIVQASEKSMARRVLPGIVSLIHEAGSLVLIEGVETQDEAMIAMDTEVDLVQGNYFASPLAKLPDAISSRKIQGLFHDYNATAPQQIRYQKLSNYSTAFAESAAKLQAGYAFQQACAALLEIEGADRCYLLNQLGVQIGASMIAAPNNQFGDSRYQPLADGLGANWIRRPYLQRALQHPKELQVTRPYLSIATGRLCVTISIAIKIFDQTQVLCYDVDWGES